ncbi:hypothetical protein QRB31_18710 [Mycobacterium avium subsp. hominissuis]|uniref:Uncharacterized protein n=1 Tax=Mycobacterium avium subsp. hominissuis TaxID=439334 RepID=A0A3B6XFQ3_MYCAV|nr:hypothetical protein [Mycobacterium avium]ASE16329.1 hypothetical protein CEP84_04080 [Mycobacterium avium subsp. paratuberculosis]ASF98621.1 hypothetical protein CEG92_20120 [Mycobacterium avium subsp. paratuberculosis]AXO25429.1 hypothetical protein DFS55_02360 [Mycobacterium avium subsp. hominissuis]AYQ70951.1 hypothetical protein EC390_10680 [Mycobacterium avium subsp. paratuberculosis]AYQ79991.1 hypothetical protein EC391_12060 [Mycobacterium avium subsp. paratuberculosis]
MAGGALLLVVLPGGAGLVSGCSTVIGGRPVASPGAGPTEPSFPTPRSTPPSATAAPAPTALPPPSPSAPAGAIPLPPDQNGYVYIETKSGSTRCQINKDTVGCEAPFTNSPLQDGEHANGVSINAGGKVQWVLGNLGAIPTVKLDYRTYSAQGWTIVANADGTRFTNDQTKHGMFVSIEKVNTF